MRSLVYGNGVNDADYNVCIRIDGKLIMCPYYRRWASMLQRCYSKSLHERSSTYIGCTVVKEWRSFMKFRSWMESQAWEGLHLDKDMLIPGNKIYGPDACIFISEDINSLLTGNKATRGLYPQGVSFRKERKKFQALIRKYGKTVHIGYYQTPEQAESAYIKSKAAHIRNVAEKQIHRLAEALRRHATLLEAKLV